MFTGLTANSKKNFVLDAGALYKGWVVGTDTPSTAAAKLIGATEGGATIAIVPNVRQIPVDGAKGKVKGLEVIEYIDATITATIKEVTETSLKFALGSITSSTPTTPTNYKKIIPNGAIADSDYQDNVTWIGKILGSDQPIMIVLKNVLGFNGWNLQVADAKEGGVPVVLNAHYDPAALDTEPVEIYIPTMSTT